MTYKIIDSKTLKLPTWKVGILRADFYKLLNLFGEPPELTDRKVRAEWILEFEDGTVAIIYDYKEELSLEKTKNWSVGGTGRIAFYYVTALIHKHYRPIIKEIFGGT